jgi:hypothetical protein
MGITVIAANYNASDFMIASLEALRKNTHKPWMAFVRDNGSSYFQKEMLHEYSDKHFNVQCLYFKRSTKFSMNHGESLNFLLPFIETEYGLILDSDYIITLKGWDTVLIDLMNHGNYFLVGSHLTVPRTHMLFFKTSFLAEQNIDWTPHNGLDTGGELTIKCPVSRMLNLPEWRTKSHPTGPFRNTICGEYYLPDGRFFGTHFGRGGNPRAAKYAKGIRFGKIRKYWRYRQDKKRWLAKAREVINAQLS